MAAASSGSAAAALPGGEPPLMADLMCGPNLPLIKAFLCCGWRTISVDWLLGPAHGLSNPLRQKSLAGQLEETDFIAAAAPPSGQGRFCGSSTMDDQHLSPSGRPAPGVTRAVSQGPGSGGHGQRGMWLDAHTAPQTRRRRGPPCGRTHGGACTGTSARSRR